jgi:hypothetical protein
MQEIINGIWVGSDKDVSEAKRRGYSRLTCAKDGPDGHREMLRYTSLGAPKDANYLFVQKGEHAALNCIDVDDPNMIPVKMLDQGLKFIHEQRLAGHKILIHCNAGRSRGPSTALAYLRTIGEMPHSLKHSVHIYKTLYPPFDPGKGMKAKLVENWDRWKDIYAGSS